MNKALMLGLAAVAVIVVGVVYGQTASGGKDGAINNVVDSAYADYCVSIDESDTTFILSLVLIKEYKELEPIRLDTQKTFACTAHYGFEYNSAHILDTMIVELLNKIMFRYRSGYPIGGRGWAGTYSHGMIELCHEIPVPHVSDLQILGIINHNIKKKNLRKELLPLLEKNTYADITANITRTCLPNLDTTFQIKSRVRITGECSRNQ